MYKILCAFLRKGHEILLNAYFVKNGRPFETENNLPAVVAVVNASQLNKALFVYKYTNKCNNRSE